MTDKTSHNQPHHPLIDTAAEQLADKKIQRRDFLRTATCLGLSATLANSLASQITGTSVIPTAQAQEPKRGGILRVGMQIQKLEDPATFPWAQMANQARHTLEYLTIIKADNTTHPMLAERWEASDDLKTWTFYLRQDVTWQNGDRFDADDVIFNIQRWVDPALGSPNANLSVINAMLEEVDTGETDENGEPVTTRQLREGALERVDDYTIRLHLSKPVLSVAEDFYDYPTAIVHRGFKPPLSENMMGTGAYTMTEFAVNDRCILKRAENHTYWGDDAYLDEIHYYHYDAENQLTAFAGGDVDTIYGFGAEQIEFAKALPGDILDAQTSSTPVARMRVDSPPFDNPKVREAIVKSIDNQRINTLVFPDAGGLGQNHHVAPIHPEFYALPLLGRDVQAARALLADAGYPDGLEISIDVGNTDGVFQQTIAEAMREQLAEAGIRLNINLMPATKYWEIWDKTAFGITQWAHRVLGTMNLGLAYRSGSTWNETGYSNPEFEAALDHAETLLDVDARTEAMQEVERILQNDNLMVQATFSPVYSIVNPLVKNYQLHPTHYHQFNGVWLDT